MKNFTLTDCFRWQKRPLLNSNFAFALFFVLFLGQIMNAQTVLINPNAEGGFENGSTFADNGWTVVNASTNTWNVGTVPGWFTGSAGAYVSNDAGVTWAYGNTANRSSFYRDVTFPANPESVTLTFDWRGNGNDGNYDNLLVYLVDTTITPTTAGPTGTDTTTTGWTGYTNGTTGYYLLQRNGTAVPTTTTTVTYSLTVPQLAYVSGATKRLVFVWKNDGSGRSNPPASVDNISLDVVVPTCTTVSALTTASFTLNSAVINWTASASNPSDGYEYEIRTSGAAGSGATGLAFSGTLPAGTVTHNPGGLTPNTSYTYYIRANCGSGDFSTWRSVTFFTGYCVPSSTSTSTYINNFSTTGGSTNISNLASGYTTGGYQNNYATATVSQYPTGIINFASDIVGGSVGTCIWVDWNNDLLFDVSERVFATTAYGYNQTGNFTVPSGTPLGDYRMRVRIDYNNSTPDPCASTNTQTEAEDYKLTVIAPPACFAPTGLTATANTPFSATLNWTASVSTPSDGYEFYYSDANTAPTSGTTISGSVGAGILTAPISPLLPSTKYYVWIRSNCGLDGHSDWSLAPITFITPCDPPLVNGTTGGSVCGQGSVALSATVSAGQAKWYAAATGGTALGTGATFNTPLITNTTSFWVEANDPNGQVTVGPASPAAQGGTLDTQTIAWEVNFTVLANTTLASVDVFPMTSGQSAAIVVRSSSGTVIATYPYTTNVSGGTTAQTVTINHDFAPGSYQLYPTLPTGGIRRNTTGGAYPYTSAVANITGNGYSSAYYMGFYNWKFGTLCASPTRTEVVATVTPAPAFALSTNATGVCAGQSSSAAVTIATGAGDYDTFVWSPSTTVTGDAANGWVFNPTAPTTYTLTASQSTGSLCATAANVTVNVNATPVVTASATQTTICEGTPTTLNAAASMVVGKGTTLTGATEQPTAFCNRYDQYWNQTIFTAAELRAAGLTAGNINSIAYNITTLGSGTNVFNFSVRIGTTTNTTTTAFVTTGFNVVYGPATYTHAVGVNTITFDTPYVWDGTSNIILDIRQDGADSTNNAITYYTATASNMTISAVSSTLSSVTTVQDMVANSSSSATVSTSLKRLNVVFGQTNNGITWSWTPGAATTASVAVSPATTTPYTLRGTVTATGCYAESNVTVNVNPGAAPTGNATQVIEVGDPAEATIASIDVTGTNVVWYASEQDAMNDENPLASTTQLVSGNTYYAIQTTAAGCRSVSALAVTVTVALGNSSFDLAGLKYYPNPTNNVLNVEYTGTITSIEVYNTLGQKVASNKVDAISTTVDMSRLTSGTYFVKVQAENASRTIKVMKN